jgi:Zn-dependent M28 family amino/carboxypeptidase
VRDALREAGLDPVEQRIGGSNAANLVATLPGEVDRWVLVAAHYDHLGGNAQRFYPGADDNAAAMAILVDVGRRLAEKRADGRGVIIAAFDCEESPYFGTGEMGSAWYTKRATEVGPPIDRVDLMVCMDLVGHALGPEGLPDDVRSSLFALGAERSAGTAEMVDAIARSEDGLVVRRLDAEIIPPLSDYDMFWRREVPFLFLTSGRSARYHTPEDTPEHLDWTKMAHTSAWLDRLVRRACARTDERVAFLADGRDDRSSLLSVASLLEPLATVSPIAESALAHARSLLAECDARGRLPIELAKAPSELVAGIEHALR